MYSCTEEDRRNYCFKVLSKRVKSRFPASTRLVLPVILLRMPQHSVTEPTDVPKWSVALVPKFFQPQHGTVSAVCERSLEKFKNLK